METISLSLDPTAITYISTEPNQKKFSQLDSNGSELTNYAGSSEYVDETADIASYYSQDPSQDTSQWSFVRNRSSSSATDQRSIFESPSPSETTQSKSKSNRLSLPTKQQRTDDLPNYQSNSPQSFPGNGPSTYSPSANLSHHSPPLSVARGLVSHGVHDSPVSLRPQFNVQEACLMRYFIDQLAKWVSP